MPSETVPGPSRLSALASRAAAPLRRRTHLGVLLIAWLGLFLVAATWSITTPIAQAPDEPAHIVKAAAVVRGDVYGLDEDGTQIRHFAQVPKGIAQASGYACSIFKPEEPASCVRVDETDPGRLVGVSSSAGLYNPVYSALIGWPSLLLFGPEGIYAMRLASALVTTLFAAVAVWATTLLPRSRWNAAVAVLVATPSLFFLSGVVTPNALEATTSAAFVATLIAAVRTRARGRLLWLLAAVLAVSGGIQVHTKSLAVVWLGIAVLAVAVWAGWRPFLRFLLRPPVLAAVIVVLVSLLLSVWQTLSTGTLGQMGEYPGIGTPPVIGFFTMIDRTMSYYPGLIALFGWNDTQPAAWVQYFYIAIGAALLAAALLGSAGARRKASAWVALGAFVLLPAVLQAASVTKSGYIWQGRYEFGLLMTMALIAVLVAQDDLLRLREVVQRRLLVAVVALAGAAQTVSLLTALWRHSSGISAELPIFLRSPEWSPPVVGHVGALALCLLAGVVFTAVAGVAIAGARPAAHAGAAPR